MRAAPPSDAIRRPMNRIIAPIFTLLVSTSLLLMGNGLQGTLLPGRGGLEGFSPTSLRGINRAHHVKSRSVKALINH